jgi:predicted lipoprotein with Yx(FWY)xxD motif
VVVAIALVFAATACGGAIPSSNGGRATLKLTGSTSGAKYGRFLVDSQGHSLYLFEKDDAGESYCNGACAAVWPALETKTTPQAGSGVDGAALGTIKRDNGEMQVTYHGHPLYYYAGDASTAGKTKGEDQNQFGDSWYLVNATGKVIEPKTQPNSGGGGGYNGGGGGGY